jgi:hypothetical protein
MVRLALVVITILIGLYRSSSLRRTNRAIRDKFPHTASHDVGYRSYLGNAGFILSHGCASDVHTSICRLNQLGSSRLAVLIATTLGFGSVLTKIGEPHSGQKPRLVLPPLALGEAWKRGEPCKSLKASAGTTTKEENGPPLERWQSRQ